MNKSFGEIYIFTPAKIIKEKSRSFKKKKTENNFMIPFRFEYLCFFLIHGIFNRFLFLRALFLSSMSLLPEKAFENS